MLSFCPALLGHTGWWFRVRICLQQWQKAYLGWLGSSRKLCYQVLSAMIWHIIVNLTSSSPLHLQTLRIWVATTTNMPGISIAIHVPFNSVEQCRICRAHMSSLLISKSIYYPVIGILSCSMGRRGKVSHFLFLHQYLPNQLSYWAEILHLYSLWS